MECSIPSQHSAQSDGETRHGDTQRSELCCGGTYEEFSRNSTALGKAYALPWIRPCTHICDERICLCHFYNTLMDSLKALNIDVSACAPVIIPMMEEKLS